LGNWHCRARVLVPDALIVAVAGSVSLRTHGPPEAGVLGRRSALLSVRLRPAPPAHLLAGVSDPKALNPKL